MMLGWSWTTQSITQYYIIMEAPEHCDSCWNGIGLWTSKETEKVAGGCASKIKATNILDFLHRKMLKTFVN